MRPAESLRTGTQETPFFLTYGAEAVVPAEIGQPSCWTENFCIQGNDEELRCNLDFLEEARFADCLVSSRGL